MTRGSDLNPRFVEFCRAHGVPPAELAERDADGELRSRIPARPLEVPMEHKSRPFGPSGEPKRQGETGGGGLGPVTAVLMTGQRPVSGGGRTLALWEAVDLANWEARQRGYARPVGIRTWAQAFAWAAEVNPAGNTLSD